MIKTFALIISAFILFSCSSANEDIDSDDEIKAELGDTTEVVQVANKPSHVIDVKCKGEFVPMRNTLLSKSDLMKSQDGSEIADSLNKAAITKRLYNGEMIRVIKYDTVGYHFVEVFGKVSMKSIGKGYIVANYCKKSTIKKLNKFDVSIIGLTDQSKDMLEWVTDSYIPKESLFTTAYGYISNETDFIQAVSFEVINLDEISYTIEQVLYQGSSINNKGEAKFITNYFHENGMEYAVFKVKNTEQIIEIHFNLNGEDSFLIFEKDYSHELKELSKNMDRKLYADISDTIVMQRMQ